MKRVIFTSYMRMAPIKKWKQLNFANQPWPTTLEWLETLAIVEGNVTDVIKLMGGLIYWNGLNIAAEEFCGL
jgi:hypothetical protein